MPIDKYYGGHGEEVMKNMKKKHGEKKGENVFYATKNKREEMKPKDRKPKTRRFDKY